MILVDTGPLVALFDRRDDAHEECRELLQAARGQPLVTSIPVLTEAFHLLNPRSRGSAALREFAVQDGIRVWFLSASSLARAFELMERYADRPMDLADASIVTAAEELRTTLVFTIDRNDFAAYRARIGKTYRRFRLFADR
jgi:predicted nucleic acid-binding protein